MASVPTPRIVVGVDGSEQSKQALRWAAQFAAASKASLEVVGAWQYPPSYGWAAVPLDEWNPTRDTEKVLTATVDEVFGSERPEDLVMTVREGSAAKVLLEEARTPRCSSWAAVVTAASSACCSARSAPASPSTRRARFSSYTARCRPRSRREGPADTG